MSIKIMTLVWDLDNTQIGRMEKYVLLAYADHADPNGRNIYPAIDLICQKTGYKERAAQLITRSLEAKGYLVEDGAGPHGTNKWRIPLDEGGAKIAPVQISAERGAKNAPVGVQTFAPEPSFNRQEPQHDPVTDLLSTPTKSELEAKAATEAFETALGFGELPWWTQTAWERLRRFITKIYLADPKAFVAFQAWRQGDGRYEGITNAKIRQHPEAFMDTYWHAFVVARQASPPERLRIVRAADRPKGSLPPEDLRRKMNEKFGRPT